MTNTKETSDSPLRKVTPVKKKEDICTNSKLCTKQEIVPFTNLSDFEGTYCRACMTTLTYMKKKPLKKGENLPKAPVYVQPKTIGISTLTAKVNKELVVKIEGPKVIAVKVEIPIAVSEPVAIESGHFQLVKAEHMKDLDHMILLTFVTENGEQFPIVVSSEPEKVAKIVLNSDALRGRRALIEFTGWENDIPSSPVFKNFEK